MYTFIYIWGFSNKICPSIHTNFEKDFFICSFAHIQNLDCFLQSWNSRNDKKSNSTCKDVYLHYFLVISKNNSHFNIKRLFFASQWNLWFFSSSLNFRRWKKKYNIYWRSCYQFLPYLEFSNRLRQILFRNSHIHYIHELVYRYIWKIKKNPSKKGKKKFTSEPDNPQKLRQRFK